MTDYETQLRDAFAKIAFERTLEKMNMTQEAEDWKLANIGGYAYRMADVAMQARKEVKQ